MQRIAFAGRKRVSSSTGGQSAEALATAGRFRDQDPHHGDSAGHPIALELTGSQASDSSRLPVLIAGAETAPALADKGYDADTNRAAVRLTSADPCIPPRRNRTGPLDYVPRFATRSGTWSSSTAEWQSATTRRPPLF